MRLGYVKEKLSNSVIDLAIHSGDARERIIFIYERHLHVLSKNDFPKKYQEDWIKINIMMKHRGRTDWASDVKNTMLRSRNSTASKIANMIVNLAFDLKAIK